MSGLTRSTRDIAPRLLAAVLVVGGLAAMLWAGLLSTRYYAVLDPRAPCLQHGLCDPAVVADDLRRLWLLSGTAAAVVLAGVLVVVLARSRAHPVAESGSPSRARDAAAGLVAAGVLLLGALPLVLAGVASTHLGVAALAWLAVSQAWILDWYAAQRPPLAGRSRLRLASAFLASVAGLAAATAVAVIGDAVQYDAGSRLAVAGAVALVVDGLVVAGVMLTAGRLADRDPVDPVDPHGPVGPRDHGSTVDPVDAERADARTRG